MGACILAVLLIGLIIYSFTDKGQMRDGDGGSNSSSKPPTSNSSSSSKDSSKPTGN